MDIEVQCYIPYLRNISGQYQVSSPLTISDFLLLIDLKWDDEALIVINKSICSDPKSVLYDGDVIDLLIPVSGG